MDSRSCSRCARASDARRPDVRHGGLLSAVAADRRQGSRDRRHQCLAHAAVQYPYRGMGRRSAKNPARAARDAAGGEGFVGAFRRQRGRIVRCADFDQGYCRRSAGRGGRAGVLCTRHDQVDLRHRVFCAAQHRRNAGRLEEPAAHNYCLSVERQAHLCAGRLDLRRGQRGAVAPRRPRPDQAGLRDRTARRQVRTPRSRSIWCRPSSAWARRTGIRMCAAHCSG